MAHSCPECGGLCYCDLEDAEMDVLDAEDCVHECEPDDDVDDFDDDDPDDDGGEA